MAKLKIGETYVFTFIGDGIVKSFKTKYVKEKNKMYGFFDCGMDVRLEYVILNSRKDYCYFNVLDERMEKYINCELYIFDSEESMIKLLPKIIDSSLTVMKNKADVLLKEYMKLADDCTAMENKKNLIKKHELKLSSPFE